LKQDYDKERLPSIKGKKNAQRELENAKRADQKRRKEEALKKLDKNVEELHN